MKLIDLHCDTAYKMYVSKDEEISLEKNNLKVSVEKLLKVDSLAQFFAIFYELENVSYDYNKLYQKYMEILQRIKLEIARSSDISLVSSYDEIIKNNKISGILTIEDGGIISGDMGRLDKLYNEGIRLITLTWNHPNCIGYPSTNFIYQNIGLTEFGREVVRRLNKMGVIIDVSHLSDMGFYDVVEISTKPFVASHSNSRALCSNGRNLKDDMIKIIANKGGVIGINLYPPFLNMNGTVTLEKIVEHIKHIRNIGGIDVLSIGTDFDGFNSDEYNMPINDIGEMNKLSDYLENVGFTYDEIEKIFYKNALRVFLQA
ncbi:MAG: hypothetical protein A2Y24_03855 [Clostridiales bacterium GWE2_32_10]|nr:MAG: hypothetical protein A2Y24_03855 [Clostridiales bacterium GWE2_32_10]HBY19595.1 peptidase M19 [Clostridiales bacterium]